jgi:hypothetical protein
MNIAEVFGTYAAEIAEGSGLADLTAGYQMLLEQDGVVFPSAELQTAERLRGAAAAKDRGYDSLNEDGSVVNVSNFDRKTTGGLLSADRLALANAERLRTMVELGLIARAGSLATARVTQERGEGDLTEVLKRYTTRYKQFVQTGIAVEEWDSPWQELVEHGFEGQSLDFPLAAGGIRHALGVLYDPEFGELSKKHFERAGLVWFAILNGIEAVVSCDFEQVKLAAAGLFYRQSPEGCDNFIGELVAAGQLSDSVEWLPAVHAGAERAAFHFKPAE